MGIPDFCDPVTAQEKDRKAYTGREVLVRVDYIMDFPTLDRLMKFPGIESPGYVIMSVSQ